MNKRRCMLTLVLALTCAGHAVAAEPAQQHWDFTALLDDKPIGEHHFELRPTAGGDQRTLVSDASFNVKFLGISAYHYKHKATEQWRGDCLAALSSSTDDDGKPLRVEGKQEGDSFQVSMPKAAPASAATAGCVMSYAYWNPAMLKQTRLLNAQTGVIDTVRISNAGTGSVDVRGKQVTATRWRIQGPEQPIDVWRTADGDWVGLDATVAGGRVLRYRLAAASGNTADAATTHGSTSKAAAP